MCNGRNNGVQWPLSCWLGDDPSHRIGNLLRIRRRVRSVLRKKRRRECIDSALIEGSTRRVCRAQILRRDRGRVGPKLNNGGVDAKGSEFVAIRLGQALQGKLRRPVQAQKRQGQTPTYRPNLQEQTTASPAHVWQSRPVHTQHAEDVGIELLLDLLGGERFQWATKRYPGIVDHNVNPWHPVRSTTTLMPPRCRDRRRASPRHKQTLPYRICPAARV